MGRRLAILAGLATALSSARADGPARAAPADFKIRVEAYRHQKERVSGGEILARGGRVYQFADESDEVVVIDPGRGMVELIHLKRLVQTEVTFRELDDSLARLKATLARAISRSGKKDDRADAIEARMGRELIEPRFQVSTDPDGRRIRLANPTVEVDAAGEAEADAGRLALVALSLESFAKLGAFRAPSDLPPFVELEVIAAMTGDRRLRPSEVTYLYRLAGPPQKVRRTYRLTPALTDRDREGIRRLDRLREVAPSLRFDQYRRDQ